ncbi:antibiotic biosynthesis monooxygenase [Cupriavidus basilensis OR16]|uniref:Antibiotic biosynthesis monooxygenase n=2 Tax=Cupriavidus basilensis TaxID=68895 RepID=H1S8M3_9BURK|nr:antibiotic biosynthesis monooxygenase [Cupriavidus basilensis OR16]
MAWLHALDGTTEGMMDDFFVLVIVYAKPGREADLREKLTAVVEPSRKDRGNLRYELFEQLDDPGRFVFLEHWASEEAQGEHHTQAEHIRRFEEHKGDLVERVELFYKLKLVS